MEDEIGVIKTEIPYGTRLGKALLIFTATCIISTYLIFLIPTMPDDPKWSALIVFIVGSWWAWKVLHKEYSIKYDGEYIDRINEKGKAYTVFVPSIEGAAAMERHKRQANIKWNAFWDGLNDSLDEPWVRYCGSFVFGLLAYALSQGNNDEVKIAICLALLAGYLAKEIIIWLIGAAIVVAIVVAVFAGASEAIASMSIPAAIIVGAIIIAIYGKKN